MDKKRLIKLTQSFKNNMDKETLIKLAQPAATLLLAFSIISIPFLTDSFGGFSTSVWHQNSCVN